MRSCQWWANRFNEMVFVEVGLVAVEGAKNEEVATTMRLVSHKGDTNLFAYIFK